MNVDFEDVKTIMGEQGQAMMGTASASGADRARVAAEQAIACPLLEGVDLNGARGVLVNITASRTLKMRETREIMETIRSYASEDATVIFGTAYDESMGENLRVTVVATGLGRAQARPQLVQTTAEALRTGTDNLPLAGCRPPARAITATWTCRLSCATRAARRRPRCVRAGKLGHGSLRHPGLPAQASGLNLEPPGRSID